ncbi:MAG: heat-shock protein, partial [Pseudomonadota bacterium]|nr:heat-shock protein [Pseudomonadota bacterium]
MVTAGGLDLVELEPGFTSMPTAVFYAADGHPGEPPRLQFGRAATAAYVDGLDGRLMRSMKSILGSSLAEQATDIGAGRSVRYLDVVAAYLGHLKARAEAAAGASLRRVVLGRP